jgi:glycosyltransferase involved in cell wall biosynthesis
MKLNIIIPTYNSSKYVTPFLDELNDVLSRYEHDDIKIIFVDDGSKDDTVNILKLITTKQDNVSVIAFTKNFGQTNAILAGLKSNQAEAYILMSTDMKEPIDMINNFILSWRKGNKLCIAHRAFSSDNYLKKLFMKLFYFIIRIDFPDIPMGGFDYGLLDDKIAKELIKRPFNFRFLQEDIIHLGYQIHYLPIKENNNYSVRNKTSTSIFKINYILNGLFNVIRFPFRILLLLNLAFTLITTVLLIYQLINYPLSDEKDKTDIYISFALLSISLVLFLLCTLIEFAIRIYDLLMHKPSYVIKEQIN